MKFAVALLLFLGCVNCFKQNRWEVFSRTPRGFPVDKVVFHNDLSYQVPVTDGHPDAKPFNEIYIFNMQGQLQKIVTVMDSTSANCGFRHNPVTDEWFLLDTGASTLLLLDEDPNNVADGGNVGSTLYADQLGQVANDLDFDEWHNIYVTDTAGGSIFFVPHGGNVVGDGNPQNLFIENTGAPNNGCPEAGGAGCNHPFAAMRPNLATTNGISIDITRNVIYVGHFGRGTLHRVHVMRNEDDMRLDLYTPEGMDSAIEEWRCCFNGLDGLALDEENGYLYATQMDAATAVVLDLEANGQIVHSYGGFDGVKRFRDTETGEHGTEADGLLSGSSGFLHGDHYYVANLLLRWNEFPGLAATGYEDWMTNITHHNVVRFRVRHADFLDTRELHNPL